MKFYADTSFLVSLYSSDAHSARADRWRQANPVSMPFTPLHDLEFRNALWQSAFQKKRTPVDVWQILHEVEADLAEGLLIKSGSAFDDIWKLAAKFADAHTLAIGARSLDTLHVAAACLLNIQEFATFDQRQSVLALRAGLKVAVI